MKGRELLAQAIAEAFVAQGGWVDARNLSSAALGGTFDLQQVADAIVRAVHAEQDQTVRRLLERSLTVEQDVYRRRVLGDWLNPEPVTPEPSMWQNIVAQVDEWRADEPAAPHAYDLGPGLSAPPSKPERWRCCVVGCNPILPSESAATVHANAAGHRVAKWPKRSEAGEAKAQERNQTGYYDRYNRRGLRGES